MFSGVQQDVVSRRDRALLRAVAAGRCELDVQCEPVLLVDGLGCADSSAARRLIAAGLVSAPEVGLSIRPAALTEAGRRAIGD